MQRHPLLRFLPRAHTLTTPCISYTLHQQLPRAYATKRGPADYTEEDLSAARKWLANLNPDTIPSNLCEITFSRSSGPGGQNVNKVSSKATLRLPTSNLLPLLPPILHAPLLASRYHAPKTSALIIQADDSRKQADNATACFRRLHALIQELGQETVPNETKPGQAERIEKLAKVEAAGRRKMKERQSSKKAARRSSGRGDD